MSEKFSNVASKLVSKIVKIMLDKEITTWELFHSKLYDYEDDPLKGLEFILTSDFFDIVKNKLNI